MEQKALLRLWNRGWASNGRLNDGISSSVLGDGQQRSVRETDEMCAMKISVTKYKHDNEERVHEMDLPVEIGRPSIRWLLLV